MGAAQGNGLVALSLAADSVNVPPGGSRQLELKAVRAGGFAGPIELEARGLPPGVLNIVTGQGNPATDFEAMKAGAVDFLIKGRIDAAALQRSVRHAVAAPSLTSPSLQMLATKVFSTPLAATLPRRSYLS